MQHITNIPLSASARNQHQIQINGERERERVPLKFYQAFILWHWHLVLQPGGIWIFSVGVWAARDTQPMQNHTPAYKHILSKVLVLEGHDLGLCLHFLQVFVFAIHYILTRSAVATGRQRSWKCRSLCCAAVVSFTRQVVGRYWRRQRGILKIMCFCNGAAKTSSTC